MAIVYPSSLDTLVNPTANTDTVTISHAGQHSDVNDAVEALEAKVGADSSAVTSSLDYKINHLTTASVTASTDKKYVTDAQLVIIGNTSGTNTGDVVKATGAEVDTGTNDDKFVTAKAMTDSDYVKLSDIPASAAFWTAFTGTYASGTTITVTGVDMTTIFKKGVALKWLSSADALKIGKVVSSSFSTDTTITIVGSTVEAGDKTFKYGADCMSETFIVAGNQSTGTNVSKTWTNKMPVYEISVDAIVSTAGTTNSTDYDLNIGGSTKITTKPSIASTATTDLDNVVDTVTTEVAVNSLHTIDIDAASTTQAIDGYITLFFIPSWWISRT